MAERTHASQTSVGDVHEIQFNKIGETLKKETLPLKELIYLQRTISHAYSNEGTLL